MTLSDLGQHDHLLYRRADFVHPIQFEDEGGRIVECRYCAPDGGASRLQLAAPRLAGVPVNGETASMSKTSAIPFGSGFNPDPFAAWLPLRAPLAELSRRRLASSAATAVGGV